MGEESIGTGVFLFALALYMIPAYVAQFRGHKQANLITILTFLFGWTGVLWFVFLIWGASGTNKKERDLADARNNLLMENLELENEIKKKQINQSE